LADVDEPARAKCAEATSTAAALTPGPGGEGQSPGGSESFAAALVRRRIALYQELGFTRERMLQQMLAARLSLAALRAEFSEFPDNVFRHPDGPVGVVSATRSARAKNVAGAAQSGGGESIDSTRLTASVADAGRKALVDRVVTKAVTAAEGISFQYVPLIQCSFPHADPLDASTFSRRNGWLELTLGTTRPDAGLPYGVPARLLTIYCTSEAVRTNSPEIFLGDSVHDFLRRLDVPITRGPRGSLSVYANQLLRLIHSTLTIDENIHDAGGRSGLHIRQALFVDEAQLWWDEPAQREAGGGGVARGRGGRSVGNGSSLTLSAVLFHSILERSAPLSTQAIKHLRKSPMDLDVYAWLVHRLFHLQRPSMVSWTQLSEQFGHSYRETRTFRRFFLDSLYRVSKVYPEAQIKPGASGVLLLPSRAHLANPKAARKR
jgi:hypothetical protein